MSATALHIRLDRAAELLRPRAQAVPRRDPATLTTLEKLTEKPAEPDLELDRLAFGDDTRIALRAFSAILDEHFCARGNNSDRRGSCPEQLRGYVSDDLIVSLHRYQRNYCGGQEQIRKWRLGKLITDDGRIAAECWGTLVDGKLEVILDARDHFMFGDPRPTPGTEFLPPGSKIPGLDVISDKSTSAGQ